MKTILVFVFISSLAILSKQQDSTDGETKIPLYIGGLLSFSGGWDASGLVPGIDYALEQINAREDLLSEYDLRIVWNDTQCSPGLSSRVFFDQIYREPQKIMILGGACSVGSEAIAGTAHYWNLISVSPTSSSPGLSNRVTYPLFYRTRPAEQSFNPARVAIMKKFGWTRVATIHENYELFSLTVDDMVSRLKEANITLITSESFVDNPKNQVESLKKHDAKIIVALMYTDQAQKVFCEAYKLNMTGDGYVWMIDGWYQNKWWELDLGQVDCTQEELTAAVGGSYYIGIRSQSLSSTNDMTVGNVTPSEYDEYVKDQLANNPNYSHLTFNADHPYGYDTAWAIALALNASVNTFKATTFPDGRVRRLEDFTYDDKEMTMVFLESLAQVFFLGMTGPVKFEKGDRVGISIIHQLREDLLDHQIGDFNPLNMQDPLQWTSDLVFPGGQVPLDHTPEVEITIVIRQETVGAAIFISMCTLACLGILLAIGFLVFNIKFREQRYVKLSSPNLNNLIITGGMIVYTGIFFSGVDTQSISYNSKTVCCQLNVWALSVGFVLSFGSMFSKTWRVYQIAAFKSPKRKVITDQLLFKMVAVLLLIDVVILIAWQVVDPMKIAVRQLHTRDDPATPNQLISPYIELCESDYIIYWLLALYIYKGILLIFGAFLAWETRKVAIAALNDSKFIGISVYNVIILCTIGVTVSFLIGDDPKALYLFISGIIIFCNTVTLLVIFIPKILSVWKHPEGKSISSMMTSRRQNKPSSARNESVPIHNLTEENDILKAKVSELNQELEEKRQESCCEMGCLSLRLACFTSAKDHDHNNDNDNNNERNKNTDSNI
ncbi:gamma-aminobutyric acid type B receptor subunit 2-like isoform X2 [Amphiura filiformis]|uniref:gamma-aminobutyric acid type B receptor subunit 2-like isoform X2 n=1 Tax=Amphiura filiformis TaxID=82378 RepID=UPI003B20E01C